MMEGIVTVMVASANQLYATNGMSPQLKQMRHLGGKFVYFFEFLWLTQSQMTLSQAQSLELSPGLAESLCEWQVTVTDVTKETEDKMI